MNFKITDKVLDKLGFSEYWDEDGDWGGRTLIFESGDRLRIIDFGEKDLDDDGHTSHGKYSPQHYSFNDFFAIPKLSNYTRELLVLSDLKQVVKDCYPKSYDEFIKKCTSLKMDWGLKEV